MATTTTIPTPPITLAAGSPFLKPAEPLSVGGATEADAAAMARVGGDTFTATFGHSVSKEDLEHFLATTYSADAIIGEFMDPDKTYLVARTPDGTVVGIAQLYRGQIHSSVEAAAPAVVAEMQKLYVATSMHGQGVGTKLIAAIEKLAREEGFQKLWLTVWEENSKAQGLYERLGYEKTGENDFATGSCIQTDWVMTKTL